MLKTDSGYAKDKGVAESENLSGYNPHWSTLPVCALAHSSGPRKRSQSPVDMLEHRDTHGQAQVCSKGHQGRSECAPSMSAVFLSEQVLACTESATSEYSITSQCLSALLGRPGRVKIILDGFKWQKENPTHLSLPFSFLRFEYPS